jgi:site-specific DNA-methyltransferase (cytosine-N4-specific)
MIRSLKEESIIIIGDSRKVLKQIPDNIFQAVITSPPYWCMRDYDDIQQIGLENTLDEYIINLNIVFNEIYRVLKSDGLFWLNIGDCYTSGNRKYRAFDKKNINRELRIRPKTPNGLKPKDLIGIPWRIAFNLQSNNWYLRSEIIWSKPNPMPESVKDRPHRSHEHLFLFSKNKKYYFDYDALIENSNGFNKTVWNISPNNHKNHIAKFPESLVCPCILSSTRKNDIILDPFFGSGTVGYISNKYNRNFVGIEINDNYIKANLDKYTSKIKIVNHK